jgi:hypothetical protein
MVIEKDVIDRFELLEEIEDLETPFRPREDHDTIPLQH